LLASSHGKKLQEIAGPPTGARGGYFYLPLSWKGVLVKVNNKTKLVLALMVASQGIAGVTHAGVLKVSSFPSGAEVVVDGMASGFTPVSIGLSDGEHQVTVQIAGSNWRPAATIVTIVPGNNDLSVTLLPEADITSVRTPMDSGLLGGEEEGDVTLSLNPDFIEALDLVTSNTFLVVEGTELDPSIQFDGTAVFVDTSATGVSAGGAFGFEGTGVRGQVLGADNAAVLPHGPKEILDPKLASYQGSATGLNIQQVQGGEGIAGEFINETGGQILSGQTTGMVEVFAVHGDGSIVTDGDLIVEGNVFKGGLPFIYGGGNYQNTALGVDALGGLDETTDGNSSTAVGYHAVKNQTLDGSGNTGLGARARMSNTTGRWNVAVGTAALMSTTTSEQSTAVGYHALVSETGGSNTAVGAFSMRDSNGSNANVAVATTPLSGTAPWGRIGRDTTTRPSERVRSVETPTATPIPLWAHTLWHRTRQATTTSRWGST
jgi:hypothetical protein